MTWWNRIARAIKQAVLRHIGYIRLMEWRNQVLMSPWVPAIIQRERREIARLRRELGGRLPSATVAVIVPTYRRHDMVLKAIDSILKQEFQDFVVVVVDDGAGLPELPKDPRIVGVSLSRNSGIAGVVRNVGIALSDSRYVAFLDDDNTWLPLHLQVCVHALEEGCDLVYTAVKRHTPSGREIDILSAHFDRDELTRVSSVDTSAIVVRRAKNVRFSRLPRNRNTLPGEDWEFVFRLSRGVRVEHLPTVTVDYLVNPESFYTPWTDAATI